MGFFAQRNAALVEFGGDIASKNDDKLGIGDAAGDILSHDKTENLKHLRVWKMPVLEEKQFCLHDWIRRHRS